MTFLASIMMVVLLAIPADASVTRSITIKTDSMPTTLSFNYTVVNEVVKVNCLNIKTGPGRPRIISISTYYSGTNKKTGTITSGFRMGANSRTRYCVANDYSAGYKFHDPFARIKVVEDVPGPWNPTAHGNFYFR